MRKIFLATVSLITISGAPTLASDVAGHSPLQAMAAVAPVSTWSGFYIGGMGGYGWYNSDGSLKGGIAGGTAGYNWQTGSLVLGAETDAAWSNVGASDSFLSARVTMQALGTARARIGMTFDQILIYGTGGYAWINNKVSASNGIVSVSETHLHSGWTAGGGIEVMLAPKWSMKGEYLYRTLANRDYFVGTALDPATSLGNLKLHTVQFGVNYHF